MTADRNVQSHSSAEVGTPAPISVREAPARLPARGNGRSQPVGVDVRIARIASRQEGVISLGQLVAAGLSRDGLRHRLANGRLHRIHRGVYLVGHTALSDRGRLIAALFAVGEGAVVSHRSAAALLGMRDSGLTASIDLLVVGRTAHSRPGISIHPVAELDVLDATRRRGVPVTTAARTLLDLAGSLSSHELEDAYERARTLRLTGPRQVLDAIDRAPRRHGASRLRELAQSRPTLTRSAAERRLLDLLHRGGLPRPQTNVRLAGHEVDLLWQAERLVVEVDGFAWHGGRAAFESDRRRDADLQLAGHRVLRVTWRRIVDEPEAVLVMLARALTDRHAVEPPEARRNGPHG